jgi:ArsR family transcriptional regulator, arsenate/arsenite/antimonite-responsive transcriptional repressor
MTAELDPPVRLLHALADPSRLAIVRQLADEGTACVCDLTVCCDLSQPTVSHHLRVLRDAGIVECERRGTWAYYTIRPGALAGLQDLARELLPAPPLGVDSEGLAHCLPVAQAR